MRFHYLLTLIGVALLPVQALAFDVARFGLPRCNAAAVDKLSIQGAESTGEVPNFTVKPSGALFGRKLSAWFADAQNAAAYVLPGDNGIGQAINRAIVAANGQGVVRLLPGIYASPGDVLIKQAGRVTNGSSGTLTLDMRGVIFTGAGNLIVDSSKQVTILGLDAKGYTLSARGMWNAYVSDSNFDVIAFGDVAGTEFSENYWNTFDNVGVSVVRIGRETNAVTFRSPRFRGDAQQGWSSQRNYAFEFNGNVNAQAIRVFGGDISYYAQGVYTIGAANTSGDVDLSFEGGTYFDTVVPQPYTGRSNVRVSTRSAFMAQPKALAGAPLAAASKSEHEGWSNSVTMGWRPSSDVNLVPNGDLALGMSSYVGAGRPIINAGGATITEQPGGVNGRYLNVNQTTTGSNLVYIFSEAVPVTGQYSGAIWARAAGGAGSYTVQVGFQGQYVNKTFTGEWMLVTLSPNAPAAAGSQFQITLNTTDGTAFNLDLMYAGVTLGDRAPLFARSKPPAIQERSIAAAPGTIAAGPTYGPTVTVTGFSGLARGDFVEVSYDQALQGTQLIADVASATSVTVQFYNPGANASKTLTGGTIRAHVISRLP